MDLLESFYYTSIYRVKLKIKENNFKNTRYEKNKIA